MIMKGFNLKDPRSSVPTIMTNFVRDAKTAKLDHVNVVPFRPGMIITRGNKRYQVDAKGTQHRVKGD